MKVVIMESLGISEHELKECQKPFEEKGVVFESFAKTSDKDTLIAEAGDADAMILANMPMSAEVLRACPNLKFIDIAFTGVDHVGLEAAKERGIAVSNASGYSNEAVSELVLGMVLSLARNMREVEGRCREGKTKDGLVGWELKGKTVGIIGLGRIGSRTAELFHAFGCDILAQQDDPQGSTALCETGAAGRTAGEVGHRRAALPAERLHERDDRREETCHDEDICDAHQRSARTGRGRGGPRGGASQGRDRLCRYRCLRQGAAFGRRVADPACAERACDTACGVCD